MSIQPETATDQVRVDWGIFSSDGPYAGLRVREIRALLEGELHIPKDAIVTRLANDSSTLLKETDIVKSGDYIKFGLLIHRHGD